MIYGLSLLTMFVHTRANQVRKKSNKFSKFEGSNLKNNIVHAKNADINN